MLHIYTDTTQASYGSEHCNRLRPENSFTHFLEQFGLNIGDINQEQLYMFVAAQRLGERINKIDLPSGQHKSQVNKSSLLQSDSDKGDLNQSFDSSPSTLFTENTDFRPIKTIEELYQLMPSEWLYDSIDPNLFTQMLVDQELTIVEWQDSEKSNLPKQTDPNTTSAVVEDSAIDDDFTSSACALLDISDSMNGRDRRGIIARGLALAFLLNAFEKGYELLIRPFNSDVGDLSRGRSKEDFTNISKRIISIKNTGFTNIQKALEKCVTDASHPYILLITDGHSKLSDNPLNKSLNEQGKESQLCTFVLGTLANQVDPLELKEAQLCLVKLQDWSKNRLHVIYEQNFASLLNFSVQELELIRPELEKLLDDYAKVVSEQEVERLKQALENYLLLFKSAYDNEDSNFNQNLRDLHQQLLDLQNATKDIESRKLSILNRAKFNPEQILRQEYLEQLRSNSSPKVTEVDWDAAIQTLSYSNHTHSKQKQVNPLELLRLMWQELVRLARTLFTKS